MPENRWLTPRRLRPLLPALLLCLAPPAAFGGDPPEPDSLAEAAAGLVAERSSGDELLDALRGGEVYLKLRYRFENVSQGGFRKEAYGSTLRTVLGYETASYKGFNALVEFEDVSPIFDDSFNSTANGKTNRPVVADPDDTEVNQVYLQYTRESEGKARLGRQRITLDNLRWIGNVGWRQNEQTYDGLSLSCEAIEGVNVFYAYVDNVNRIFGENSPSMTFPGAGNLRMQSHLLNVSHELDGIGKLSVYGYRLDFDTEDAAGNEPSTDTVGARLAGKRPLSDGLDLLWSGELAHQHDSSANRVNVDANYYQGEVGLACSETKTSARLGMEILEGSGQPGDKLTTPLATLHAYNGWADKFLTTPDEGLKDLYLGVAKTVRDVKLQAIVHDYRSDAASRDFGHELDLDAVWKAKEGLVFGLRYANYHGDDDSVSFVLKDTHKFWAWMSLTL